MKMFEVKIVFLGKRCRHTYGLKSSRFSLLPPKIDFGRACVQLCNLRIQPQLGSYFLLLPLYWCTKKQFISPAICFQALFLVYQVLLQKTKSALSFPVGIKINAGGADLMLQRTFVLKMKPLQIHRAHGQNKLFGGPSSTYSTLYSRRQLPYVLHRNQPALLYWNTILFLPEFVHVSQFMVMMNDETQFYLGKSTI